MAHVERRAQGRWRARYRDPSRRERSRTFPRRSDAERWLAAVESSVARGEWLDPQRGATTVEQWVTTWVVTRSDLRPTTRARVQSIIDTHIIPRFGHRRITTVSNSEVRLWVANLSAAGSSPATVRKCVAVLRQAYDAAVADRRVSANPCLRVPLPAESAAEQMFLSPDQIDDLADAMPDRYRALVTVACYTGLRWGELTGLRRGRVDTFRSRIHVVETAVDVGGQVSIGEPKTKRSRRTVPVPRTIMRAIEEHMAAHTDADAADALVFANPDGSPLRRSSFRHVWRRATRAAGLEAVRFHDCRHSFVSMMVAAGAGLKEVSTWAGHSSASFTADRYQHVLDGRDDEVADRLDALLTATAARPRSTVRTIGQAGS